MRKPHFTYSFPSLKAFTDYLKEPRRVYSSRDALTEKGRDDWAGTETAEQAFAIADKGWPEGLAHMVAATASAAPVTVSTPSHVLDVAGHYPLPALAAAGEPMSMVHLTESDLKPKPIIKLGVNVWVSMAYKAEYITNYGAAILSYIDSLESTGARIELAIICHANMRDKATYTCEVMAKQAQEPLELDRLAFMLAHPSMLRRFFFGHMERQRELANCVMGCGMPLALGARDDMLTLSGLNTFCEPRAHNILSNSKAIAERLEPHVNAQLSAMGHEPPQIVWGQDWRK